MPIPDAILPREPSHLADPNDLAQEYLVALRELLEAEDDLCDALITPYDAYLALCSCDAASDRWEAYAGPLDRNRDYTIRSN